MKLSPRLTYIASFVTFDMIIADIGSDHGFLPYYLLDNKIVSKAYACDNKLGPYKNLLKTFDNKFNNQIEIKCSDGLNDLPNYVNTIIMTGMGGDLIIKLLSRNPNKLNNIKYLVLSPQSNIPIVRNFLINNGFKIVDEGLVKDDKIYHVIKCQKGSQNLNQNEIYFGPILLKRKNALFIKYYSDRLNEIESLLNKQLSNERFIELKHEFNLIKDVLNEN